MIALIVVSTLVILGLGALIHAIIHAPLIDDRGDNWPAV
jgi:hypothetical protein